MSYLLSAPSNLSNCSLFRKKPEHIWLQHALFGYFWVRIFKKYCCIWNQHPPNCLMAKFFEKINMPKLRTKNVLFGYFLTRIKKNYSIFEISTLKFFYLQNFTKKQKCLNLRPRMPNLVILGLQFEKNIVIFEISTLEFV